MSERDVSLVLPLASDKEIYVLERFALVLNTKPEFRRLVMPQLIQRLGESRRDNAARIGLVLMLAGDTSGESVVSQYLLGYTAPIDAASPRQVVSWCSALSKKGYRLGLDATIHLFELHPTGGTDEWLASAISSFAVATEFPRWWSRSEAENLRTAQEAVEWWKRNRDLVTFDPLRRKFVGRSGR